jgi:hypothetical protein
MAMIHFGPPGGPNVPFWNSSAVGKWLQMAVYEAVQVIGAGAITHKKKTFVSDRELFDFNYKLGSHCENLKTHGQKQRLFLPQSVARLQGLEGSAATVWCCVAIGTSTPFSFLHSAHKKKKKHVRFTSHFPEDGI